MSPITYIPFFPFMVSKKAKSRIQFPFDKRRDYATFIHSTESGTITPAVEEQSRVTTHGCQ